MLAEELERRGLGVRQERDRQVVLTIQRGLQRAGARPGRAGRREDAVVPPLDRQPERSALVVPGRERTFGRDDGVAAGHLEEDERKPVAEGGVHRPRCVGPLRGCGPITVTERPRLRRGESRDAHRQLERPRIEVVVGGEHVGRRVADLQPRADGLDHQRMGVEHVGVRRCRRTGRSGCSRSRSSARAARTSTRPWARCSGRTNSAAPRHRAAGWCCSCRGPRSRSRRRSDRPQAWQGRAAGNGRMTRGSWLAFTRGMGCWRRKRPAQISRIELCSATDHSRFCGRSLGPGAWGQANRDRRAE